MCEVFRFDFIYVKRIRGDIGIDDYAVTRRYV